MREWMADSIIGGDRSPGAGWGHAEPRERAQEGDGLEDVGAGGTSERYMVCQGWLKHSGMLQ